MSAPVPASDSATDPTPLPVSGGSVRWGILATGLIAGLFVRDLVAHGHRVTAVGSRSLASAEAFAAEHGIPTAHGSYEALAADPDVDVIYVATPHPMHAANATLALEHGKHVLVEKSFTMDETEARGVVDLADRLGLVVLEAMWTRFLPSMAFVRDALAAGRIGEVRSLHADHTQRLPQEDSHRLNDPNLGGGALLDLGIYPVSFAHDILGSPTTVDAQATFGRTGVDASIATILTHAGGTVSTSFSSLETRGPNRATILGTEGRIELDDTWYAPTRVFLLDEAGAIVDMHDEPVSGRGMQFQAAEMERLVGAGRGPGGAARSTLMAPEDSVAVMRTMDAIRRSVGLRYPGEGDWAREARRNRA